MLDLVVALIVDESKWLALRWPSPSRRNRVRDMRALGADIVNAYISIDAISIVAIIARCRPATAPTSTRCFPCRR